jgi:hypothetical protein
MTGCIKNTPYVTTLDPYMTAQIGTYNFTAKTVVPTIVDTQSHTHDTASVLYITGNTSDILFPNDKIILGVSRYRSVTGTLSIVQGQAGAVYIHNGISYPAMGGIVAITKITSNSLIGYFSFQTASGVNIVNGAFNVGKPWNY